MFKNIEGAVINAICYKYLHCSSVQGMNDLNCDAFKVRAFYKEQKNLVDLALQERTDSEQKKSI